ncbi:MAG: type IV pilus assembly protein PilW [Psychromonas sp.]|jgi:type IV pilus assembly protein PilW|uniref:prepilin-type N-terminal cleavage/methylation domain-containing protein n=1 Tax=Psychromonas sp. TaxID=1884585 RepID=UPI0039E307BB
MATIKNCRLIQQRGFTLIELMISIPLGLLVMFAVLKIFTANVEGVNLQNAFSRVQENGRMATELLIRDIRGADYWGCLRDTSLITNNLDTSDDDYVLATQIPTGSSGIAGENNVDSGIEIADIPVKEATDTLTLRGASAIANIKIVPPYAPASSSQIKINSEGYIPPGTIIMIGDCGGADVISVTNNNGNNDTVVHNSGTINIANSVNNAHGKLSRSYSSSSLLMTPYVKTYFIGQNLAGSYSLFSSDNGVANELVRGVTDLQLEYGEDTGTFSEASSVNMTAVRSIRFSIVAESSSGSGNAPLARTYTVTSNIRNRTLQ